MTVYDDKGNIKVSRAPSKPMTSKQNIRREQEKKKKLNIRGQLFVFPSSTQFIPNLRQMERSLTFLDSNTESFSEDILARIIGEFQVVYASHDAWQIVV